jgi:hypothetical protein
MNIMNRISATTSLNRSYGRWFVWVVIVYRLFALQRKLARLIDQILLVSQALDQRARILSTAVSAKLFEGEDASLYSRRSPTIPLMTCSSSGTMAA